MGFVLLLFELLWFLLLFLQLFVLSLRTTFGSLLFQMILGNLLECLRTLLSPMRIVLVHQR